MAIIGLDVGGTKIEIAIIDQQGKIILKNRVPTERSKGHQHIMNNIHHLILDALNLTNLSIDSIKGIGIGLPGAINPKTQMMINGNTDCFVGKSVASELKGLLNRPNLKINCANDANCFALAETIFGAGREVSKDLNKEVSELIGIGVILGTGCGSGIVINGRIFEGSRGGAGESGRSTLINNGHKCYCGRDGCVELYLSGHGLEKNYHATTGKNKKATEIFDSSEDNSFLHEYQENLANFLTNLTNILDPDFFVLGGGLSTHPAIYESLNERIQEKQFLKELPAPKVLQHKIGDSSGVLGAALLVDHFDFQL